MTRFDRALLVVVSAAAIFMVLAVSSSVRQLGAAVSREIILAEPAVRLVNDTSVEIDGRLVLPPERTEVCVGDAVAWNPVLEVTADARLTISRWLKQRTGPGSMTLERWELPPFWVERGDVQITRIEISTGALAPGAYYVLVGFADAQGRRDYSYRVPFRVIAC